MKLLPPMYYKTVRIADNANDIYIDEKSIKDSKAPDTYAVFVNEYGMIRKVIKHSKKQFKDTTFLYSNKGNLISYIFINKRGITIQEKYDYTIGKKTLFTKDFYKANQHIKREKYDQKNMLVEIIYYMQGDVYYKEYFKDGDKHPFNVEYFNKAGLRI